MATKLYVGNMSFKVIEDDLGNLFAQFGNVLSAKIITDRETNRSKGFGFIEMEEQSAADEAIRELNESVWMDRKLVVNAARERTERPRYNDRY
ncbi:RNA recognition motif domain-containing protein [Spirochaeta isovalerica]|uniref:RNA recognition motif-containing protein n=1 Tax=Spirochaeta isovalerica TaxID=150 RepID=A0A841RBD7_9SPIO|nr:RNA-binding protein [Spirochaeta isovalerica]MBB6481275.1 RNA recognition motif-containing protein [Spirochaeta isovalerica]